MLISHIDSLAMQAVVPSILQREWALEYGLLFKNGYEKTALLNVALNLYDRISMHKRLFLIFVLFVS